MKLIGWLFGVGLAMYFLGQRGPDIDIPTIVPATPWMIRAGLALIGLAAIGLLIRARQPRYLVPLVPPARLNRAEMAVGMKMNGGMMPFK